MIFGSLSLLVAVLLLARGLATGSVGYLVASVAASLVAVGALVVKGRRAGLINVGTPSDEPRRTRPAQATTQPTDRPADDWREPAEVLVGEVMEREAAPAAAVPAGSGPAEARPAYKLALDKAGKDDAAFRESVRVRLEALGG